MEPSSSENQPINPLNLQYQPSQNGPSQLPSSPTPKKPFNVKLFLIISGLVLIIGLSIITIMQFNQSSNELQLSDGRIQSNTVPPIAYFKENINPGFSKANNVKRKSDVTQILNALGNYVYEGNTLPENITSQPQEIASNGADICALIVDKWTPALPQDPLKKDPNAMSIGSIEDCTNSYETGYSITKNADNTITVSAPLAEENEVINVRR